MPDAIDESVGGPHVPPTRGLSMKSFTLGLLGAAALATTILLVRHQREDTKEVRLAPAGESQPAAVSLERIRELGL